MKFLEKLSKFMYGRNGNDQLNIFITVLTCATVTVNIFLRHIAITVVALLLLGLQTWRMLSKNIYARRKENALFLKFWNPVAGWFKLTKNKIRDRKTHVFKKCPKCKAVLRLPKKKGSHTVICPKCKNKFDLKI